MEGPPQVKRSKRVRRVVVSADGHGVVSHAGVGLLREMAGTQVWLRVSPALPAAFARAFSGIRVSAAAEKGHDRHLTRPA